MLINRDLEENKQITYSGYVIPGNLFPFLFFSKLLKIELC